MRIKAIIVSITTSILLSAGATTPVAVSAASVTPNTSCNVYSANGTTSDFNGNFYTDMQTVPSASSCHDIQVKDFHYLGPYFCNTIKVAVVFYPSSGGTTLGTTKTIACGGGTNYTILATNVQDGTHFKIIAWSANAPYAITIED